MQRAEHLIEIMHREDFADSRVVIPDSVGRIARGIVVADASLGPAKNAALLKTTQASSGPWMNGFQNTCNGTGADSSLRAPATEISRFLTKALLTRRREKWIRQRSRRATREATQPGKAGATRVRARAQLGMRFSRLPVMEGKRICSLGQLDPNGIFSAFSRVILRELALRRPA